VDRVPLVEGCKPVKQKLRRIHPDVLIKVKAEIKKQWNDDFLEVVKYPRCVSNIVVAPKKEDKIRVCVDFRDLNWTSPKNNFSLPHLDMLVDNASRSYIYSVMDGFLGYNQIKMTRIRRRNLCNTMRNLLLQSHAIWVKERWGYLPKGYGDFVSRHDAQRD
jgi:hypothetical protein